MGKNTSVALGAHFEEFVHESVRDGRYKNASEVIRAGLRLLEDEEQKYHALKNALQKGIESGLATDFDPCLLYTSPSPRDRQKSRMPSSA